MAKRSEMEAGKKCHEGGEICIETADTLHRIAQTNTTLQSNCCLVAKSYLTIVQPHGLQPTSLFCPQDFPGKKTGVGCHFPLEGIFMTQGSNPCLLHWQADSLPMSQLGSNYFPIKNKFKKFKHISLKYVTAISYFYYQR